MEGVCRCSPRALCLGEVKNNIFTDKNLRISEFFCIFAANFRDMTFLIASDSFKGSCSSLEVAHYLQRGLQSVDSAVQVRVAAIADGGEGTVQALTPALGGEMVRCAAHDALMREIDSEYGWVDREQLAIVEVAQTAGLTRIAPEERDAVAATSYGLGEQLAHAIQRGARRILLGLGGSATTDAGRGMMQALEQRGVDYRGVDITALCDVNNPLYGPQGAAYIYAPQKGANHEQVLELDARLRAIAQGSGHPERALIPGAGAAGGLGFAVINDLGGALRPGIDSVLDLQHFDELLQGVDWVITGEGKMDAQTLMNKAPIGVLRRAQRRGIPCMAIAGKVENRDELLAAGFADIVGINPEGTPLAVAMTPDFAHAQLIRVGQETGQRLCLQH